ESETADKIRERRKDGKLINLDGVFLNAPAIARGYNELVGAIRLQNSLDPALRELLILRVAALNSAAYEWIQHEPVGRAGGLTDDQLRTIRDVSYVRTTPRPLRRPQTSPPLTAVMAAALAYTDAMTVDIKVPQEVFDELKRHLDDKQLMEVTATVASYNLVSRVLMALDVSD
ncbi:hypothetical protein M422DRAFT_112711, partial [Sphaerobolus stellatus SS14]